MGEEEQGAGAALRQAATDGRKGVPAALGRSGAGPQRRWAAAAPHRRFVYLNLIMGLHSYGCMCTVSFVCM